MLSSTRLALRIGGSFKCRFQFRSIHVVGKDYTQDEWTNVTPTIAQLAGRQLHLKQNHPIQILRSFIEKSFANTFGKDAFTCYSDLLPVVSTEQNFDSLGFPMDHPGRNKSDTYYINEKTVLRTHTSAHQVDVFKTNKSPGFLITADVYRRDAIDRSHYPVFHQMEGCYTWDRHQYPTSQDMVKAIEAQTDDILRPDNVVFMDPSPPYSETNPRQLQHSGPETIAVGNHLKRTLELLMSQIFLGFGSSGSSNQLAKPDSEPLQVRWIESVFPFTSPSWELEVFWQGEWLEVLGCGVVQQSILERAGQPNRIGWAFGLGLERLAMLLFGIPDIRLFWSVNPQFLHQFRDGKVARFEPFSKYPSSYRDVSFWLPGKSKFTDNDMTEIVRTVAGDLVQNVSLTDNFTHPKTSRTSLCYRVVYQSMERTLQNEEINEKQAEINRLLADLHKVELR